MNGALQVLFWAGLALLVYAEAGYLGLLWIVARLHRPRPASAPVTRQDWPGVTVLIAAHDEELVIGRKLENTLALDCPPDKLQILVVSDGSGDTTDEIVRGFAPRVALLRVAQRGGKVAALRAAEGQIRGEIVLFSDADSMYRPDVLKKLVRHFDEAQVGAVSGHEVRVPCRQDDKGKGEGVYARLDNAIKALEGRVGSQVMVNGRFFAIRRALLPYVPDHLTHDGVVPPTLHLQGYRTAYEPEALSEEIYALDSQTDFRRRVRTVLQAAESYLYVPAALNPLRTGIYALQIWSHHFLRWLVLPILACVLAASLLSAPGSTFYTGCALAQTACYALALGGAARPRSTPAWRILIPVLFPVHPCGSIPCHPADTGWQASGHLDADLARAKGTSAPGSSNRSGEKALLRGLR